MNVTELFRRLSYGELSNLSIGSEGAGSIPEAQRPKIIGYTNDALLRLYTKFVLKESSLVIELQDFITSYRFVKKFAQTHEAEPGVTRYIMDLPHDPFCDDLIKVMKVFDGEGQELPLNDAKNEFSLFTPEPGLLQVPYPKEGVFLSVLYQAQHPVLSYTDFDACIELPVVLEEAMRSYIAYKVFFHMNGQDNGIKAAGYLKAYEGLCQQVIDRDLVNSSVSTTPDKFEARGFV